MIFLSVGFLLTVSFQDCGRGFDSQLTSSVSASSTATDTVLPGGTTGSISSSAPLFACADSNSRGTSDASIRRLTRFEYENTLKDIFGTDAVGTVAQSVAAFPDDVFKTSVSEFNLLHSSLATQAIIDTAAGLGESVAGNVTFLKRVAPACLFDSGGAITLATSTCLNTFVTNLGLQIYRRPLTSAEATAYVAILQASSTVATSNSEKVAIVVGQMLMQPEMFFLFPNATTVAGNRLAVDPYTVASRLSYRVIGSLPDADLFAAAKAGQLSTVAQLKAQALRLLNRSIPAGQANFMENPGRRFVRKFFSNWLQMSIARNPDLFYSSYFGVTQGGLNAALAEEAMRFGEYITFDLSGNYKDLMTSAMAFPPNADVAKIMGTGVSNGSNDPKLVPDGRRGLFERPISMVADEPRESPLHRGAQYLRQAMCVELGAPPANADNVAANTRASLDLNNLTARQVGVAVTNTSQCLACHSMINPPGFAFESFGPLGEFRTAGKIFDVDKTLVNNLPVDASSTITLDGHATSSRGPEDLASIASDSAQMKACMARQLYRYTRFKVETPADNCHLSDVEDSIRSGASIAEAIAQNAATEDLLWLKGN